MQNLQTITEIFSKQCSRCKKTQHICQFGVKGDRTEYKHAEDVENYRLLIPIIPGLLMIILI